MDVMGSFILAAFALTGSPGPNTLGLAAVGAAFGRTRGIPYMLGLNLGMIAVILMVGSGVHSFLFTFPLATPVISVVAAAYFLYLAYRIASAPPLNADIEPGTEPKWFAGTFQSLVNPKAYAAMAAMFSGFTLVQDDPFADGLLKATALMSAIIVVNICWLLMGSLLTDYLKHDLYSRLINVTFAGLLILSVVATVLV